MPFNFLQNRTPHKSRKFLPQILSELFVIAFIKQILRQCTFVVYKCFIQRVFRNGVVNSVSEYMYKSVYTIHLHRLLYILMSNNTYPFLYTNKKIIYLHVLSIKIR